MVSLESSITRKPKSRACATCGVACLTNGTFGWSRWGMRCDKCMNWCEDGRLWELQYEPGSEIPYWRVTEDHEYVLETFHRNFNRGKEYWYFITWTHNDDHTIEEVRTNIDKFVNRDLGFIACDIVLETGATSGRLHYHMRVKLKKPLKKQKLGHYEKVGHIDFVTIKKHTKENWENLEGYMSKEADVIALI